MYIYIHGHQDQSHYPAPFRPGDNTTPPISTLHAGLVLGEVQGATSPNSQNLIHAEKRVVDKFLIVSQ